MSTRIAVVGAGPAGLTAAIAARRLGFEVVVYEQAPELGRVGGGIALQSNGQRVLAALSLLAGFEARMETAATFVLEGPGGRRYARMDYGVLRVPFPRFAVVLRADLQRHLLDAAEREGVRIDFDRRCTGVARDRSVVSLRFASGATAECTVVLAADGTRSAVRASVGLAGEPILVGAAALRGVAERPAAPGLAREIWLDDGRLFGIAPLPAGRTYFYCSAPPGPWSLGRGHLRTWIDSWRHAQPEASTILDAVGDWTRVSHDELREVYAPRWWGGGGILLGDAAHAMTPNLGQGANSAMVDALVVVRLLREMLDSGCSLDDVGRRYETIRRPVVRRIQAASRAMCRIAAWRSPAARLARRALMTVAAATERVAPIGLRLGAGINPPEKRFLAPLPGIG